MLKKILVSLVAVVATMSLGACTINKESSPIVNDPVFTTTFAGLEEINTFVSESVKDKVQDATRCLGPIDPAMSQEYMDEVIDFGKSNGWEHSDLAALDTKTSMVSHKLDDNNERMTLLVTTEGFVCGSEVLQISMTY